MSTTQFYRAQAEQQQQAADDAELDNVRDRCQRASPAWAALARRSASNDASRDAAAVSKIANEARL